MYRVAFWLSLSTEVSKLHSNFPDTLRTTATFLIKLADNIQWYQITRSLSPKIEKKGKMHLLEYLVNAATIHLKINSACSMARSINHSRVNGVLRGTVATMKCK